MSAPFCQHIHIICQDMAAMVDFWVNGFEATVDEYRKFSGADGAVLDINMSAKLYLKQVPCQTPKEGEPKSGFEHIGMVVQNLDQMLRRLSQRSDVKILSKPFLSPPVRCCYVQGPEGVMVEMMEHI